MVHTISWRVASDAALDFWEQRLEDESDVLVLDDGGVTFEDPEGLRHHLAVSTAEDAVLTAEHPEIPAEHALQGFDGVRAFAAEPNASRELLETTLGFIRARDDTWEARGETRGGFCAYDEPPA